MSLNHVVREQEVDVAHFIDLDAIVQCAEVAAAPGGLAPVAPLYPHVKFQPADRPLDQLIADVPVLRDFADRGRLVWYYHDFVTQPGPQGPLSCPGASPVIRVDAFSAEAVVNVLAAIGVKTVRHARHRRRHPLRRRIPRSQRRHPTR